MPIDYSRLRTLSAREIVSALLTDGFRLRRQNGAHRIYPHPDRRRVTVSFYPPGETFELKTLRSMIENQAHWTQDDLSRLHLPDG